jgi:mono/diheme cytochrome c family protein
MSRHALIVVAALAVGSLATLAAQKLAEEPAAPAAAPPDSAASLVEHGRYIVKISGCHDCHTPMYALTGGEAEPQTYLVGDSLGWQGPWGTTYAINLRIYMQELTEEQWMKVARTRKPRPPMPWMALHAMNDRDLRAVYHYIRSLGPGGEPAPAYVPPDEQPNTPVVKFPEPPPAATPG